MDRNRIKNPKSLSGAKNDPFAETAMAEKETLENPAYILTGHTARTKQLYKPHSSAIRDDDIFEQQQEEEEEREEELQTQMLEVAADNADQQTVALFQRNLQIYERRRDHLSERCSTLRDNLEEIRTRQSIATSDYLLSRRANELLQQRLDDGQRAHDERVASSPDLATPEPGAEESAASKNEDALKEEAWAKHRDGIRDEYVRRGMGDKFDQMEKERSLGASPLDLDLMIYLKKNDPDNPFLKTIEAGRLQRRIDVTAKEKAEELQAEQRRKLDAAGEERQKVESDLTRTEAELRKTNEKIAETKTQLAETQQKAKEAPAASAGTGTAAGPSGALKEIDGKAADAFRQASTDTPQALQPVSPSTDPALRRQTMPAPGSSPA